MTSHTKMLKKIDILPRVKYYRKLLYNGQIKVGGAAYTRLRHLQEKYMGLL